MIVSSIDSFLHQEASNFKLESTNQAGGLCRYTERAKFCLWNSASSWKTPKKKTPQRLVIWRFEFMKKKTRNLCEIKYCKIVTLVYIFIVSSWSSWFTEYLEIALLQICFTTILLFQFSKYLSLGPQGLLGASRRQSDVDDDQPFCPFFKKGGKKDSR